MPLPEVTACRAAFENSSKMLIHTKLRHLPSVGPRTITQHNILSPHMFSIAEPSSWERKRGLEGVDMGKICPHMRRNQKKSPNDLSSFLGKRSDVGFLVNSWFGPHKSVCVSLRRISEEKRENRVPEWHPGLCQW